MVTQPFGDSDGRETALAARDVPYSLEGAEEEHLDMRLAVVGFPTVEADIVRDDWDRWTWRADGR